MQPAASPFPVCLLVAKYLYTFGNGPEYWVTAVTPVVVPVSGRAVAENTYLCKGFHPTSPLNGSVLGTSRPLLQWEPYPAAVDYAVRVVRTGDTMFLFSRGDNDPHLRTTTVQVDVDLSPGEYRWRVHAFNGEGHIIGCSYFPRTFVIG